MDGERNQNGKRLIKFIIICFLLCILVKITALAATVQKLSYKDVKFIAHRGLSSVCPENTKPAFTLAGHYPFYGIETDIWESTIPRQEEDDEGNQRDIYDLMCMHDSTTARMCDTSVSIQSINKGNRAAYPVTKGNGNSYSNLLIPTLDEYLEDIGSKAPIIEIKESSISDRAVQTIIEDLREKEIQNAIIITFHKDSMSKILKAQESEKAKDKNENPITFKVMYLKSAASVNSESVSTAIEYCKNNKINIIGLDKTLVTDGVVKDAHQKGVEVSAYTVDDPSDALYYIDMGVDYLTTNQKLFLD